MSKYIIFDFDGVIGDTWEAIVQAVVDTGTEPTREKAIQNMNHYFSCKPQHTRSTTMSPLQLSERSEWVSRLGQLIHDANYKLFTNFISEIEKLQTTYKAVVSSGSQHYVLPAIAKTSIFPTHVLAYEDHHSKEEKIELIAKDWGITAADVYYVTDTLADVYELRNIIAPEKLIGVSWGFCTFEQLATELDEQYILKEQSDIHNVL